MACAGRASIDTLSYLVSAGIYTNYKSEVSFERRLRRIKRRILGPLKLESRLEERKVTKSDPYDHKERLAYTSFLAYAPIGACRYLDKEANSSSPCVIIGSWSCFTPGLWSFARREVVLRKNGGNRDPGQTYMLWDYSPESTERLRFLPSFVSYIYSTTQFNGTNNRRSVLLFPPHLNIILPKMF